ncbi:Uncharacterised protein [Mycobacteroides abscessus subsp. abscessus]|nr:Uncharacterised protein [Mycobacteroides abscessus subsp. abscessus]
MGSGLGTRRSQRSGKSEPLSETNSDDFVMTGSVRSSNPVRSEARRASASVPETTKSGLTLTRSSPSQPANSHRRGSVWVLAPLVSTVHSAPGPTVPVASGDRVAARSVSVSARCDPHDRTFETSAFVCPR